jgi:hypothetical protein
MKAVSKAVVTRGEQSRVELFGFGSRATAMNGCLPT